MTTNPSFTKALIMGLFITVNCLLIESSVSAQSFSDPGGLYRFTAPPGWTLQGQQDGGWVFGRAGRQTMLVVGSHAYANVAAVLNDVSDQQDAGSQTYLQARTERVGTNGILATFTGTLRGQNVVLTALTLLAPTGGGIVMTTIAPQAEHSATLPQTLRTMAAGVTFGRPQASPVARQWQDQLSGRQLLYFYTASGYSEKHSYDLCANGSFVYNTDTSTSSSGFGDQFSAATQNGNTGTWRVGIDTGQPVLLLSYRSGRVARLSLTMSGNNLLLNGKKYYRQASQTCR